MQEESHTILPNIRLRDERKRKNWTQTELAEQLGVTELTVRRWERGQVVPSAYHTKKLCALFTMTREELGLVRLEPPKAETGLDENATKEIPTKEEDMQGEERVNALTAQVEPGSGQVEQEVTKGVLRRNRGYGPRRRHYIPLLALASGLLIVLASFYARTNLYPQSVPTRPLPTQSVPTRPLPKLLYQADWSQGLDINKWAGGTNWEWSPEEGGTIATQSQVPNGMLVVPYQPATSNYRVEVQIKRDGYTRPDGIVGLAYGMVVGLASNAGYVCGVGEHYLPEHFFLGQISFNTKPAFYQLHDQGHPVAHLDEGWHNYLIEVTGHKIRYMLDGKQIADLTLTIPVTVRGKIGIYVDHAAIEVRNLKVFAVST